MAGIDLTSLSMDELKQLKKDVTKAIDNFEARRMAEAQAAMEVVAKEHGFSLADIVGGAKGGKSVSVPKYQHPENPALTWSGRGRRPAWFIEAIEAGTSEEDLLISK